MKRLQEDIENKPNKKIFRFIKLGVVLLVAICVLEIWISNRLATYGSKVAQMKNEEAKITLQNQLLEDQIAQDSSLLSISKEAAQLGFNSISNLEYFTPSLIASAK